MYMKFLLIKPKMLYALFIFIWMWSRKESSESKITPKSFILVSFFYLVIYTTIIYKVLCVNPIFHAIRYSFTFIDIKSQ